jgi:hypothetical protein
VEGGKEGKWVKSLKEGETLKSPQVLFPIQTCPLDAPPTDKNQKTLSLFPFSKFFIFLFEIFYFWKTQILKNQICCGKGEK